MKIGKQTIVLLISMLLFASIIPMSATVLAAAQTNPVLVSGDFTSVDFNVNVPTVTNGTYTPEPRLLGAVATTAGSNLAGVVTNVDGSKAFLMEADTANVGSYKGGINKTDRFGIQTRMEFNNTNSQRNVFQMKSTPPTTGTAAWPTLLVFDQYGNIKDSNGKVLGPYAANQWYDIVVDVDTPNHWYSVWINGTQMINNQDLGNWTGLYQNNITQYTNASKTASQTMIAYVKAGTIVPPLQALVIPDMTVDKGKAAVLTYQTVPNPAYVTNVTWTSSDPSVAKVVGNGLLALNTGVATITATESYSGISKSFQVTVQEPAHTWSSHAISADDLAAVLWVGYRPEMNYSSDQIMNLNPQLQTYMDMNESDFIQAVKAASAQIPNPDSHTSFERYARLFAQLYKLTNDPKYARKAALILYYQALDYPRIVVNHNYSDFYVGNNEFPQNVVAAYGLLIDSDIWGQLVPNISAGEVKQTIEGLWLRPAAYECIRAINSMRLNNITPYGGRSSVVTAMLLNDPYLIREVIDIYDRLLNGNNYFNDAMWYEETTSYGDQVSNNAKTTVDVLKDWTDPAGYVDTKLGLKLDKTDLNPRWPLLQQTLGFNSVKMIYPDGTAIPINDTYGKTGNPQPLPIVGNGLKNIELPGLGYYGLFQGDTNEATHAGLLYQPTDIGFGGHTHENFLSLDLWGAGVEMLPHTGYVNTTSYADGSGATLRYPSFTPLWRNMPWVWRQDGANAKATGLWEKPELIAYDPGTANGKQVQLVEASDPGPDGIGAAMNRRLIMLVNLDGNRNYTFDLTRMQGGQAHEIFQRGPELENMDVQVQGTQLTATGQANLQNYLTSINSTQGLMTYMQLLQNPKAGSGNNSFSFTWKGQQTGSSIHTFMNGVSGSDVFLSTMPTARRITTKADETKYVTPHLVRRNIVSDSAQITQYGAVHEIYRQGQTGDVTNVEWLKPDDGDPMTNVAVVTSNTYVDMIYTSGDTKERTFNGITFAGSIAVARIDAATGKLVYSYVYGSGKVTEQNASLTGYDTQVLEITAATTASTNMALDPAVRENTITVNGKFPNKDLLKGQWLQTRFGDGSGIGVKVKGLTEVGNSTVITLEQYTPFSLTDTGVQLLFSPNVFIPGKAYVVFNLPKYKSDFTPPEITVTGLVYGTYSDDPAVTPVIALSDNLSGVDNSKTTVTLDTYGVQQDATIALYTLPLGSHTYTVTSSDLAGNVGSTSVVFQTKASIQSIQALVTLFTNKQWIDSAGISNSLQSKLAANDLVDFVSAVQAQSGKHISSEAAKYLLRDARYVLSQK
ncbi:Ig-like domain-containing protein [Paenibacillus sp. Soil787]|uniref:Ig-like domain-containing protein n=1 Tax=Paenibacillus sp. Soil787 TaxID=1736411 RepID=UPI0006FA83BA|nr:Ig-like domain-containing protein [Paenibacillus sp. Soil787]KRF43672.1 hypothetical protein ASG93_01765 [Paenibacillus sp. Soil787]